MKRSLIGMKKTVTFSRGMWPAVRSRIVLDSNPQRTSDLTVNRAAANSRVLYLLS